MSNETNCKHDDCGVQTCHCADDRVDAAITARERVAEAIEEVAEIDNDLDQTACGDIWLENPAECADAAIAAHNAWLWERAGRPPEGLIDTVLTALIGPRPQGASDER